MWRAEYTSRGHAANVADGDTPEDAYRLLLQCYPRAPKPLPVTDAARELALHHQQQLDKLLANGWRYEGDCLVTSVCSVRRAQIWGGWAWRARLAGRDLSDRDTLQKCLREVRLACEKMAEVDWKALAASTVTQ